uniref:Phospholipase-like protein n=1 Tax=Tanacetum cinerariifolium TaxID=118510 RepID=A0A6L2L235_TANCI|nr:phospholipase-like protein [Tanacetum cinerariifolium]
MVLPNKVSVKVTNLDLVGVIEDEKLFGDLSDEDVVRVCLFLSLEMIFMGRLLVDVIEVSHIRLVKNIDEWNVLPWGGYIWRHLYDQILNEYLIQEEIRLKAEQEESWRLQEHKMVKEVFVKRLKEEVMLRVEKEKLVAVYAMAKKDRESNHLSDEDMTQFLKDVKPWAEYIELWVNYMWHVRPIEAALAMVGAYFVQIILQDSFPICTSSWYPVEKHRLPIETIRIRKHSGQAVLGRSIYWLRDVLPSPFHISQLKSSVVLSGTFSVGHIVLLCGWNLAVDAASVTSFSMLFSIPTTHSVKLIGFTNNDAPIVEVDELGSQWMLLGTLDAPSSLISALHSLIALLDIDLAR